MRWRIVVCALALFYATSVYSQEQGTPPNPRPPAESPSATTPSTAAPPATTAAQFPSRIRVGGNVMAARMLHMVQPEYPRFAKAANICGTIVLDAVVAKDGTMLQLQYVSGPRELMRAAMDAVRQWRYQPTLLNGRPVEAETKISVIFQLAGCNDGPQVPVNPQLKGTTPPTPAIEGPAPQASIDPQLKADILHLFEVMHMKERTAALGHTLFESLKPTIAASLPPTANRDQIADAYLEKLIAVLQSQDFIDQVVEAYAKYFSEGDIRAATQFYESPAGQHFSAATSQLGSDLVRIGQQMAFGSMPSIWKELCKTYPELQGTVKLCPGDGEKKSFLRDPDLRRPGDVLRAATGR